MSNLTRTIVAAGVALTLLAASAAAFAAKPGTGGRHGDRVGLRLEPGRGPERPVTDRPERLGDRSSGRRIPQGDADRPGRKRVPARPLGADRQRDGQSGLLADEHLRLQPKAGRVRAGDGVLLDHRVPEVHPEPRLRHRRLPSGEHGVAARPDQPVGARQLVCHHPQGRAPLRQGRSRRRRGRRGGHARVRPCPPLLAELRLFGGEGGAISEGFSDYWAVTTTLAVRQKLGLPALTDPACVADWDATSYDPTAPHCLRRIDTNLHYPGDLTGAVHADGRIWSRALWDIRSAIGNVRADTVILEGQFDFPGTTMTDLANRTVATASRLYGASVARTVRSKFHDRGIL